jgi:hypothetical protein
LAAAGEDIPATDATNSSFPLRWEPKRPMRAHEGGRFASRQSSSQSSLPLPLVVALWSSSAGDFIVFDACDKVGDDETNVEPLFVTQRARERERERETNMHEKQQSNKTS